MEHLKVKGLCSLIEIIHETQDEFNERKLSEETLLGNPGESRQLLNRLDPDYLMRERLKKSERETDFEKEFGYRLLSLEEATERLLDQYSDNGIIQKNREEPRKESIYKSYIHLLPGGIQKELREHLTQIFGEEEIGIETDFNNDRYHERLTMLSKLQSRLNTHYGVIFE